MRRKEKKIQKGGEIKKNKARRRQQRQQHLRVVGKVLPEEGGERASEREREHLYVVGKVLPEEGGECTVHDRGNPQLRVCESAFSAGGRLCDAAYRNRPLSVVYLLASGLASDRGLVRAFGRCSLPEPLSLSDLPVSVWFS